MEIENYELKARAKEQIQGNIFTFFWLVLVRIAIEAVAEAVVIGPLLISGALELGLTFFILDVVRKGSADFQTGFKGFNSFINALIAKLISSIYICLLTCLLVVPGIIAALSYSMTFFILADNPDMNGYEAMLKSKEMMNGHKSQLFMLNLSFIGWILLIPLTCGIAAIYVYPYMFAAHANFYEELKKRISPEVEYEVK